jgi:hypothetical protein
VKYQFIVTFWGERHSEYFATIALPSLLTSGNLLGFPAADSEFDIYTTAESKARLMDKPIMAALSIVMNVRVTTLPGNDATSDNKYDRYNAGCRAAMMHSAEIGSVMFLLASDGVFADGTLAYARKLIEGGKRAVLLPSRRVETEPFLAEFNARFSPNASLGRSLTPRQLASLALRYPDRSVAHTVWGNKPFSALPSHVLFPADDEGYILRGLHQHPIAVYPSDRSQLPKTSPDGRWLRTAVPDLNDWQLIADTDDGCLAEVGTVPGPDSFLDGQDPEQYVADWMAAETDDGHHWMAKQNVYVHHAQRSSCWVQAEELATTTFDLIFKLYERPTRAILALARECAQAGKPPIALYGVSDLADRVAREMNAAGLPIAAIFDSDRSKHGRPFGPLVISPPGDVVAVSPGAVLILARGPLAQAAICNTIILAGYSGKVVCWRDL